MKNAKIHHKLLTYGLNKDNSLAFIEDVPNGLACGCVCPCCKERLIAKNMGKKKKREHHFAHSSGNNCQGYYETALHLLAKEVIKTEKSLMLPVYGKLEPQQIQFEEVEVEERNDSSSLQPDCVGIASDGLRLHIEIFVTHQVDDYKKSKIKEGNINCIEIKIPRDFPLNKEQLQTFIVDSTESREWINYPHGDKINVKILEEIQRKTITTYREKHPESHAIYIEKCFRCIVFSTKVQQKYNDFINSYINRIHEWAIPIAKLPLKEIIQKRIFLKFTKFGNPYVRINNKTYWIYPKNKDSINQEEKWLCGSTYGFFMNLMEKCSDYVEFISNHESCEHFKEKFEYQGQWYVFCDYKDHF